MSDGKAYRLFFLGVGEHIAEPPLIIQARSDEEALAKAELQRCGRYCELWLDARRIGVLGQMQAATRTKA
jgi:hypothetical protein